MKILHENILRAEHCQGTSWQTAFHTSERTQPHREGTQLPLILSSSVLMGNFAFKEIPKQREISQNSICHSKKKKISENGRLSNGSPVAWRSCKLSFNLTTQKRLGTTRREWTQNSSFQATSVMVVKGEASTGDLSLGPSCSPPLFLLAF